MIAAIDNTMGIGKCGYIPWNISQDLVNFKNLTEGYTVIMGRKTYYSIPPRFRPLKNRHNIVISDSPHLYRDNFASFMTMGEVENYLDENTEDKIFIIGGENIYKHFLYRCDTLYLTEINKNYDCDTFFPRSKDNFKKNWESPPYWSIPEGCYFTYNVYKKLKTTIDNRSKRILKEQNRDILLYCNICTKPYCLEYDFAIKELEYNNKICDNCYYPELKTQTENTYKPVEKKKRKGIFKWRIFKH
jgi:dihydrofolate reductase